MNCEHPVYPILNIDEFDRIEDKRDQLPVETQKQLSENDVVVHIVSPEIAFPITKPSALREIIRLAGVDHSRDIGRNGSAVASLSSTQNSQIESLRKFEVVHGRDALQVALDLHENYPELLKTTIIELSKTQGQEDIAYTRGALFRGEEPGRIILLDRLADDPIGKKFSDKLGWGFPFYGSIDATPTFISATSTYVQRHDQSFLSQILIMRDGKEHTIQDGFERSVDWLVKKLNENPYGLLEFKNKASDGGMSAQAWKDSAFAYIHADGTLANHEDGIASVEVQALAYDALLDAATIYNQRLGNEVKARDLESMANALQRRVLDTFWTDEKDGYFVLATDKDQTGGLRTLNVRSSNMGRLLNSRMLDGEDGEVRAKRQAIVKQLFTPELLHSSGIRTLASDEVGFRPGGYHTGAVWLWDTAFIADGLARHGYDEQAWELRKRIWQTTEQANCFPEFVSGTVDDSLELPKKEIYVWNAEHKMLHLFEQPPQEIQAWTVSAILRAKRKYYVQRLTA